MAVKSWVHVASAARQVVEDTASRGQSQNEPERGMSGPAQNTSLRSKASGVMPSSARLVLPWPDKSLNQNARDRWASIKAKRAARKEAWALALQARVPTDPQAVLRFSYCPPDRRARDVQNMPAMLKAAIDGIADAMGCDDRNFRPQFPDRFGEPCKGGAVIVEINPQFGECIP